MELEDLVILRHEKPSMFEIAWRGRNVEPTEVLLKDYLVRHLTKPFMLKKSYSDDKRSLFSGTATPSRIEFRLTVLETPRSFLRVDAPDMSDATFCSCRPPS